MDKLLEADHQWYMELALAQYNSPPMTYKIPVLLRSTKANDPRLKFCMMYKETSDYGVNYVKNCDEYLNVTLVFVSLSVFPPIVPPGQFVLCYWCRLVINVRSKLGPGSNER